MHRITPRNEAELKRMIQEGIDALNRGDYVDLDKKGLREFFDGIKREGRERLKRERQAKKPRFK